MSSWIESHKFVYWLITAAVVLAVILPIWASGHHPMWPVSISTLVVVGGTAAVMPRVSRLRMWFQNLRG
jgi:hypothetical protein